MPAHRTSQEYLEYCRFEKSPLPPEPPKTGSLLLHAPKIGKEVPCYTQIIVYFLKGSLVNDVTQIWTIFDSLSHIVAVFG